MRQLKITKSITNRESASLDKYLQEIGREELVSPEEEVELAQRIRQGDQAALEKLTRANLRFVVSVAKQYQNQGLSLPDLINEGNLGLIKAAEKFDETRGFKFISYAVWWIRQSIMQAISDSSTLVRVPLNQTGIKSKVNAAIREFEQEHQRKPSAEELSEITGMDSEKIEQAMGISSHHSSIDAPFSDDETTTISDTLTADNDYAADTIVDEESMRDDLDRVLRSILTKKELYIVKQSFGIGCPGRSLEDIAEEIGITRERARQIRERSIRKVRCSKKSEVLLSHL